ncbi:unnamed protein product [Rotaria magnacalcarata]|uniref:SUEL-type lectin domain-containing protein n=3 Tax=Rotaria magnacalcarata TaxID=392030 RepID=A0A816WYQ3_9BILA|nr:unnamed protein product [Rotaria magnacalcarata]
MVRMAPTCADLYQGRVCFQIILVLSFQVVITFAYTTSPTPWFCTDPSALDLNIEISRKLPSCLPGYAIEIEEVVYESTSDGTCSGRSLCSYQNRNALSFACNNKQKCNVDIRHSRFHINKTCGSTVRFFTKYRCLPVIQEQKNYSCESTMRQANSGDINLFCDNNYRLHIKMALVGIIGKPHDGIKTRVKCNKNTYWLCNHYVQDAYRSVCNNQLSYGTGNQCKIRFSERPRLNGCEHGDLSNFSLVEYACIPGESINEDLPRIDICSGEKDGRISINRGLLQSPNYPQYLRQYVSCMKQLHVPRESRLRLFMLEKSLDYYQELNIRLLNNEPNTQRTLAKNELFDKNITNPLSDEIVEIELKTNHIGTGNFLLYFQVDSRISEYAASVFENGRATDDSNRREKLLVKRDWGVVIGCLIGLISVILIIGIVLLSCRILKSRRARTLKYMRKEDDHRQHFSAPPANLNDNRHPTRGIKIEHPHLLSSPPKIISPSVPVHDTEPDRETLLKHGHQINAASTNTDNFYEEIKEHQQQTNFNLGNYPELKNFEDNKSSQPISDHRETEPTVRRSAPISTPTSYQRHLGFAVSDAPMASTETLNVGSNSAKIQSMNRPAEVPPPRMDLSHPLPSAPPRHLLQTDLNENMQPHQRMHHMQN